MIGKLLGPGGVEPREMTSSENNKIDDNFAKKSPKAYTGSYPRSAHAIEATEKYFYSPVGFLLSMYVMTISITFSFF